MDELNDAERLWWNQCFTCKLAEPCYWYEQIAQNRILLQEAGYIHKHSDGLTCDHYVFSEPPPFIPFIPGLEILPLTEELTQCHHLLLDQCQYCSVEFDKCNYFGQVDQDPNYNADPCKVLPNVFSLDKDCRYTCSHFQDKTIIDVDPEDENPIPLAAIRKMEEYRQSF